MTFGYLALECKRLATGARFWSALVLAVVLYLLESSAYGDGVVPGTDVRYAAYLMGSFAAWGAIHTTLVAGSRIPVERATGWQRQLRLTPLRPSGYLLAKVVVGMVMTLPAPVALAVVGSSLQGVRLPASHWAWLVVGLWLATLPFAVLGTLLGQLVRREAVQGCFGGAMLLLGLSGGVLMPATRFPPWLRQVARVVPSYWLADVAHGALPGSGAHPAVAAAVLAGWTVLLGAAVVWRHRRDTAR